MSQCKHVASLPHGDKSANIIPFPRAQRRPAGVELPPDISVGAIAEFGALTGEPTRIAMLMALLPGEPLTAGDLAAAAGVTAQTASGHLSRLTAGGLLAVTLIGRRRLHRYASPEVQSLIRSLYLGGSHIAKTAPRRRDREATLVVARVCGGHLAGHLGVALAERLVDGLGTATPSWRDDAAATLAAWGLSGAIEADQVALDCCIDWSEKSAHIAGPLGALLLRHGLALGWLRAIPGSSALTVTAAGRQGFQNRFGITFDDVALAVRGNQGSCWVGGDAATPFALVKAQHVPRADRTRHLLLKNLYWVDVVRSGDGWRARHVRVENTWWHGAPDVLFPAN